MPELQGLVALSRLGVYIRVPGVDVAKFEQSIQGGGLLGYIDALSGGSISKVGVFSLGQQAQLGGCNMQSVHRPQNPLSRKGRDFQRMPSRWVVGRHPHPNAQNA